MLLGQVGQDVGVEDSSIQETAPQCGQLGAELAHVPADLLRHFLVGLLQLMGQTMSQDGHTSDCGALAVTLDIIGNWTETFQF